MKASRVGSVTAICWGVLVLGAGAPRLPAAPPKDPAGASKVLQGFEDPSTVKTAGGKLETVSGGEGITEGKRAGRIAPGVAIEISLPGSECERFAWMRFDTLTVQPLPHRFRIRASGEDVRRDQYAYVQPGKDTLALPLSWLLVRRSGQWPQKAVRLSIANASDRAVILDNVRLVPAAKGPQGGVLVDFGDDRQLVWPGFERGGTENRHVVWSGNGLVYAHPSGGYPDPLGGDSVGPNLGTRSKDYFDLKAPGHGGVAHLWVTHFGYRRVQPVEYALMFRGKKVLQKRRSTKQLLGPEGLLEGMDGEWTPEWYDKVYAPRFVEVVKLQLRSEGNRIDVGNCQLAAVAMAPTASRDALAEYVKQVNEDLSRFRRQFIVGERNWPHCDLVPTAEERKAGVMLFSPPVDQAFGLEWRPQEKDRVKILRPTVPNGEMVTIPIVVVPLEEGAVISGVLGPLRAEGGRALAVKRERTGLWFLEPVPRVVEACAESQPWILAPKRRNVAAREVVWAVLALVPQADNRSGVYKGAVQFSIPGGQVSVPLEVRVADIGRKEPARPTMGALYYSGDASYFYPAVAATMSKSAKDAMTARLRGMLLSDALNALHLDAVSVTSDLKVVDTNLRWDLSDFPPTGCPGRCCSTSARLGRDCAKPGSGAEPESTTRPFPRWLPGHPSWPPKRGSRDSISSRAGRPRWTGCERCRRKSGPSGPPGAAWRCGSTCPRLTGRPMRKGERSFVLSRPSSLRSIDPDSEDWPACLDPWAARGRRSCTPDVPTRVSSGSTPPSPAPRAPTWKRSTPPGGSTTALGLTAAASLCPARTDPSPPPSGCSHCDRGSRITPS